MKLKVAQSCPTLCDPMDYTLPGILQARILEWVAFPCSRGSSQPKDRTHVSRIAGDSLPAKPQGKPKTTGVGNLSLLQQIFSTQELNRGLLNCRQILYQLSYKGRPLLITREMHIKGTMRYHFTLIRMMTLKKKGQQRINKY